MSNLHPILERPHEYDLLEFRYAVNRATPAESFIDMKLSRQSEEVTLRFWQPVNLSIEAGFPRPTRGMVFYDRRGEWLENIGIEVADFEASPGSILFSARSVERLA